MPRGHSLKRQKLASLLLSCHWKSLLVVTVIVTVKLLVVSTEALLMMMLKEHCCWRGSHVCLGCRRR